MEKKILDLGCGGNKKKNSIGFDCADIEGVDVVGNLMDPLPFKDNEFDVVYLDNVLEHLFDFNPLLEEVFRITKNTGRIYIQVPYYNNPKAIIDPTHKRFFHENTFDYFTKESNFSYYSKAKFKIIRKELMATSLGLKIPRKFLPRLATIFGGLANGIRFILQPDK